MLLRHLPAIFLGLFFAELAGLIWLGGHMGILGVLALIMLDFLIGVTLIRRSGTSIFSVLNRGNVNSHALSSAAANSLFDGIAGILFIIPGIITDMIALLLLVPALRQWLAGSLETQMPQDFSTRYPQGRGIGQVIDVEATEISDTDKLN